MEKGWIRPMFLAWMAAFCVVSAEASHYVIPVGGPWVDTTKPVHLLISGFADEVADAFLLSAMTHGMKLKELYPSDQVVILRGDEDDEDETEEAMTERGIAYEKIEGDDFSPSDAIEYASRFRSGVRTFSIYSHSSAYGGARFGKKADRLNADSSVLGRLKEMLTPDAVVMVNGCNSGYDTAPRLSERLGVPVLGSLTATNFERLHSDGNWYTADENQAPPGPWASSNSVSFKTAKSCRTGGCLRMRPENHPYIGLWSDHKPWKAGLGIYKGFCRFDDEEKCLKGLARIAYEYPTSAKAGPVASMEEFQNAAKDFLCPSNQDGTLRKSCFARLDQALHSDDEVYSPFQDGISVECTLKGCNAKIVEDGSAGLFGWGQDLLKVVAPYNFQPKTLVREYKLLLKGFEFLRAGK